MASSANPCLLGPNSIVIALQDSSTCAPGFFCPNSTNSNKLSFPQACPATPSCVIKRLNSQACQPQGIFEPQVCPSGFYCPTQSRKIPCPSGSYCKTGSLQPQDCGILSQCPANSSYRVFYGGALLCVILDLLLLAMYTAFIYREKQKAQKLAREYSKLKKQDLEDEDNFHQTRQSLIFAYRKAFGQLFNSDKFMLQFQFRNLGLTLKDGKEILSRVTGSIENSKLTAIIGQSGAGKTTFLNVLMGKVQRTSGDLLINGQSLEMNQFKKIIGYVPQDDIMLRDMTVRETIKYSAQMRLPRDWDNQSIDNYVDAVLDTLGLSHVQHTLIGDETSRGISQGQRKRVNIALELASCPLALFLDEPTSGLDSTSALKTTSILKNISQIGVTVVAVLHQPRVEIFAQFDEIILLAAPGKQVYHGPNDLIVDYFKFLGYVFEDNHNPADILMDIVSGKGVNVWKNLSSYQLIEFWEEQGRKCLAYLKQQRINEDISAQDVRIQELYKSMEVTPFGSLKNIPDVILNINGDENSYNSSQSMVQMFQTSRNTISSFKQTWLSMRRSVIQQMRLVNSLLLEIGVCLVAGGLIGMTLMGLDGELFRGIYISPYQIISPAPKFHILPEIGMLIAMSVGLSAAPAAVKIFGEERVVYWREAASGHNRFAYFLGKNLSVFYRFVITSLHFTSVFYLLVKPQISFEKLYLITFILYYCVYGLSTIISMIVKRENAALLAVIVCLAYSVFNLQKPTKSDLDQVGLTFLWELSYPKWITEAFFTEEAFAFDHVYDSQQAADIYGYTLGRFEFDIGIAFLIGTVFRVISYILMITLQRQRQK